MFTAGVIVKLCGGGGSYRLSQMKMLDRKEIETAVVIQVDDLVCDRQTNGQRTVEIGYSVMVAASASIIQDHGRAI